MNFSVKFSLEVDYIKYDFFSLICNKQLVLQNSPQKHLEFQLKYRCTDFPQIWFDSNINITQTFSCFINGTCFVSSKVTGVIYR